LGDVGWIKIYRCLTEKAIWTCSTPEHCKILITLLMMANSDKKQWVWQGKQFEANPGQFVTSADSIIKKCGKGITRQNVRSALTKFEKLDFLTYETTKTGMLITIVNWEVYQDKSAPTNQESNQEPTNRQPTGNQQATTNKNNKNNKKDKKDINNARESKVQFAEFVSLTNAEYSALVTQFSEHGAKRMIEILDDYKGASGKTYKSDYRAIRTWVIKRYTEELEPGKKNKPKQKDNLDRFDQFLRGETFDNPGNDDDIEVHCEHISETG